MVDSQITCGITYCKVLFPYSLLQLFPVIIPLIILGFCFTVCMIIGHTVVVDRDMSEC